METLIDFCIFQQDWVNANLSCLLVVVGIVKNLDEQQVNVLSRVEKDCVGVLTVDMEIYYDVCMILVMVDHEQAKQNVIGVW